MHSRAECLTPARGALTHVHTEACLGGGDRVEHNMDELCLIVTPYQVVALENVDGLAVAAAVLLRRSLIKARAGVVEKLILLSGSTRTKPTRSCSSNG